MCHCIPCPLVNDIFYLKDSVNGSMYGSTMRGTMYAANQKTLSLSSYRWLMCVLGRIMIWLYQMVWIVNFAYTLTQYMNISSRKCYILCDGRVWNCVLCILYQIESKEQNKKHYICLLVGKKVQLLVSNGIDMTIFIKNYGFWRRRFRSLGVNRFILSFSCLRIVALCWYRWMWLCCWCCCGSSFITITHDDR